MSDKYNPDLQKERYIFPPQAKETIYRIESSEQHLPTFQLAVRSQVTVSGIIDLVSMSQLMCAGFAMVEGPPFLQKSRNRDPERRLKTKMQFGSTYDKPSNIEQKWPCDMCSAKNHPF